MVTSAQLIYLRRRQRRRVRIVGSPPAAEVGTSYDYEPTIRGGSAPYTLAVTGGALPDGLAIDGLKITGTPTEDGVFHAFLQASGGGRVGERQLEFVVVA